VRTRPALVLAILLASAATGCWRSSGHTAVPLPPAPPMLDVWRMPGAVALEATTSPEPATPSAGTAPEPQPRREPEPPAAAAARDERASPTYTLLADVALSSHVEAKVARIARGYFTRTGKILVVTSGTRDAERQAEAMHAVLQHGGDLQRTYRNKGAAREIEQAHAEAAASGRPAHEVVAVMATVIRDQMARGVFLSAHLRAGAVDVRSRGMSTDDKQAFLATAAEVGGVEVLEESAPPHFHLQLDE
jgi:hypothetical protein